jgi:beta-lactamase regulating signal transducer with metallopeptidase domain
MIILSDLAVWLGRHPELALLIKSAVVLALALLAAWLLRHGRASTRHLVLASAFGIVLFLPLAAWVLPSTALPVVVTAAGPADGATDPALGGASTRSNALAPRDRAAGTAPGSPDIRVTAWLVLTSVWAAGALLLSGSLALALARLARLRREGIPCLALMPLARQLATNAGLQRPIAVVTHERVSAPLTCGVLRPTILLPCDAASWTAADVRRALVHEIEHARRGDWLVHVAARAVCALHWFNPLAWAASRRLSLDAERACDDAVLRTEERTDYAEQLVALAARLGRAEVPAASAASMMLGMARRSDLSVRVAALLDARQRRGRTGLPAAAAIVAASVAAVGVIGPLRAVAAPSTNGPSAARAGQGSGNRALFRAAERGDVERITQLLAGGANPNATFDGDGSPLIAAARNGRLAAVRLLLDAGADPNLGVEGDGNALIMAAREGHADVVTLLLDRGASIDQVVDGDENALIQASGEGQLAVVKLLVSRGADVNARVWVRTYGDGRRAAADAPGGVSGGVPGGVPGGVAGGVPGGVSAETVRRSDTDGEWRSPLSMARAGGHAAVVAYLESVGAR